MTTRLATPIKVEGGVGASLPRPDGIPKLKGEFPYSSDLRHDRMLWGATVRSPHPHARIVAVDLGPALAVTGVHAALVASDIPGVPRFGQKEADQPVLADGEVRFWGEAVCVVAADDREAARRAAAAVVVTYEPLEPLTDSEEAVRRGETFRTLEVVNGDQALRGEVAIEGYYEIGAAGPGDAGHRVGPGRPRRRGRGGPLHLDPVDARGSPPDRRLPRPPPRAGAPPPRRHRRRLRSPRGPHPADPPLPAGPAHRAPGEDGLRPGRVVRRPRPPPPRPPVVPPRGRPAGQPGARRGPHHPRRRGLRGDQWGRGGQLRLLRRRPLPLPVGEGRRRGRAHQQPAGGGDARLRGQPGLLRL